MSPGGDPILSCLLVGVRVMQGGTVHAEHHTPVCGLLCRLVDDVALVYLRSAEPIDLGLVVT